MRKISKLTLEAMEASWIGNKWKHCEIAYFLPKFVIFLPYVLLNQCHSLATIFCILYATEFFFYSMTAFQIKLLIFQGKCNKCLNRSEVKLMRGRKEKKKSPTFFSRTDIAFYLLHALRILSSPVSWKDCSHSKKAPENAELSEHGATEEFWHILVEGKRRPNQRISLQGLDGVAGYQWDRVRAGRVSGLEASFCRWCGRVPGCYSSPNIIQW